jgi:hypothetical protein
MAYTFKKDKTNTITVNQNAVSTSDLPILLYGKSDSVDYGAGIQTNLYSILENFSSVTSIANPVPGMIWFDDAEKQLKIFTDDDKWLLINTGAISGGGGTPIGTSNDPGTVTINSANGSFSPNVALTAVIADLNIPYISAPNYKWYLNDVLINQAPGSNPASIMPEAEGSYKVIATYEDSLGNNETVSAVSTVYIGSPREITYYTPPISGDYHKYVVPNGVSQIDVTVIGGGGGGGGWQGGNNAVGKAANEVGGVGQSGDKIDLTSLAVVPGEVLYIYVGCGGSGGARYLPSVRNDKMIDSTPLSSLLPCIANKNTWLGPDKSNNGGLVPANIESDSDAFLFSNAVWSVATGGATTTDKTYSVYFPRTSDYIIYACGNYSYTIYVDNVQVLDMPGFDSGNNIGVWSYTYAKYIKLTAGYHDIRLVGSNGNGGEAGIALEFRESGSGFNHGGSAGLPGMKQVDSGASGFGGGSSAIVRANGNEVLVVAAGGGGAGGSTLSIAGDNATGNTVAGSLAEINGGIGTLVAPFGSSSGPGFEVGGAGGGGGYDPSGIGSGKGGVAGLIANDNTAGNKGKSYIKTGTLTVTSAGNGGIPSTYVRTGDGGTGSVHIKCR